MYPNEREISPCLSLLRSIRVSTLDSVPSCAPIAPWLSNGALTTSITCASTLESARTRVTLAPRLSRTQAAYGDTRMSILVSSLTRARCVVSPSLSLPTWGSTWGYTQARGRTSAASVDEASRIRRTWLCTRTPTPTSTQEGKRERRERTEGREMR